MRPFLHRFPAVGGLLLLAFLCTVAIAGSKHFRPHGATIIVSSINDSGPGTLRQAITDANDGDTIIFLPSLSGQTITLTSGELVINNHLTINGSGSDLLTVSRSQGAPPQEFRIFHITPNHTVAISGLTISGGLLPKGSPSLSGAGIYNEQAALTVDSCKVSGNVSFYGGGGIANTGTLTVSQSTIIGNYGGFDGGGILNSATGTLTISNSIVRNNNSGASNVGMTETGFGGGIYNAGMAVIVSSTIDNNVADADNHSSRGGGIYSVEPGSLSVSNSTISQNVAFTRGGAIFGGGSITNCTISGNIASQGGGIYVSGALQIGDTILNRGVDGANILNDGGTITSHGYNVSSDNGGGFLTGPGDQINTDPLLGPLQNNGGPTFTHEPLSGSPAINMGDPNFTPPPSTDQRSFPRVFDGRIDIGSFEVQPVGTISPTPTATATATIPPPGPATHFTFVYPPDVLQYVPFTFTVTARDQFGKVALGYAGTVHFTSSDHGSGTQLPNDSTLKHGTGTFDATLTTTDYQTITATDTVNASITGTTGTILVFANPSTPTPTPTPCSGTVVWSENFDGVVAPALPPGWVATNPDPGDGTLWVTSTTTPDTAPNCAFIPNQDGISDKVLDSPPITIPSAAAGLRFRNNFDTEFSSGIFCDGGVLEVSSPNISGGDFLDITDSHVGGSFLSGGYTGEIGCGPLPGRMAWVGDSGGYINTVINLGPILAGQTITLRFRFLSDEAVAAPGWRVDTMSITDVVCPTPTPTPTPTLTPTPTPATPTPGPAQPLNLSTRLQVGTGSNIGIAGFIIGNGTGPKRILIRGIGPSLTVFGVPDALADTTLELRDNSGALVLGNDNWRDTQEAEIQATGIPPTDNLESALIATVDPGQYTALLAGKNNTEGVGLVEVYDLTQAGSQLLNLSTRAFCGAADDVVIAGFILGQGNTTNILIRGVGPSLGGFGIPNPLPDPTLELRDSNGTLIAANDNCGDPTSASHPNEHDTIPGGPCPPFCGLGSCPPDFCGPSSLDACIYIPLPPGAYTAILSGKNGATGVGLVEIYNLN